MPAPFANANTPHTEPQSGAAGTEPLSDALIEKIWQDGHSQGREEGFAEGYVMGYDDGREGVLE